MKKFLYEFGYILASMCKHLAVTAILACPIAVVAITTQWLWLLLYFVCVPASGALSEVWRL